MFVAFDEQFRQIIERLFGARHRNLFALYKAAQYQRDFNIEQMRCVNPFGCFKRSVHQALRLRGPQQDFEHRRGVEYDQRLSRSARSKSVGVLLPR